MKEKECIDFISSWLFNYLNKSTLKGFVVGVSGGIDSAVASTLAAHTKAPVLCLEMPIFQQQSQVNRANNHISWLKEKYNNVHSLRIDLSELYQSFEQSVASEVNNGNHLVSLVNTKARLRMTTLYYYAQLNSYLVVGTGNKVEDFGIGFFTKYGDGGVDISPIADLLKSEVYAIGKQMGIIDSILLASPTDGLWEDNRTDEEQIGATYNELEWAMNYKGNTNNLTDKEQLILQKYHELNTTNTHKMIPIPVCNIPDHFR